MKKIVRMTRSRAIVIVSVLAIAMSTLFAGPASAASNGQQVGVCGPNNARHVSFLGHNQDGNLSGMALEFDGWCPVTWGWWWKGYVVYTFYDANWTLISSGNCWVPEQNSADDYWC